MKKIAEFAMLGFDAVPWSVPDIGTGTNRAGKKFRFTTRPKKTVAHLGKLSFADWKTEVARKAGEAFAGLPLATPVRLHLEFIKATPKGHRHGELWIVGVKKNEAGKWVKEGRSAPDLVNLFKGTEDALEGVVYANDVQTRMISSVALYGPLPGVRVVAYSIDEGDFPGHGEPVA